MTTSGCPCRTNGPCCDNQDIVGVEHECSDESVCEECFVQECLNCGARCCCDL